MDGDNSEAVKVFVVGVLGLVGCQLLSPIAWSMGNSYVQTCRLMDQKPDGLGVAGRVLGILGTVMLGLTVLGMCAVFSISR